MARDMYVLLSRTTLDPLELQVEPSRTNFTALLVTELSSVVHISDCNSVNGTQTQQAAFECPSVSDCFGLESADITRSYLLNKFTVLLVSRNTTMSRNDRI